MTTAEAAVPRPEDREEGTDLPPTVVMRGIRKSFGTVEVLHGVDFDVLPGEVHVLAGENGAGKSTLIKILSGVYADFGGDLFIHGTPHRFSHPSQAARAGVATIHQELSLVPGMTVADNLFLGRERTGSLGRIDFRAQEAEALHILAETGLDASPRQLVGDLSLSGQQILEIARALARDAAVVVFDEPTSALSEKEVETLFGRILELKRRGCGVVYITHKMEEIYRLADRITVLRDGKVVGTASASALPPEELVQWMVGRDLREQGTGAPSSYRKAVLEVDRLRVVDAGMSRRALVADVSFRIGEGEIVGLAGLEGSGKSEVLHALFGALGDRVSGTVWLKGEPYAPAGPRQSVDRGVVLMTNDRKTLGLAPEQSVVHSVSLASLGRFSGVCGWMRPQEERDEVLRVTSEVRLSAPSLTAPVRVLSGGNQQKVYLARCLLANPAVLLLDEPTRGIDVGAKADIYDLMRNWVAGGGAILLTTSEMDELLTLCHRILAMHRGRLVGAWDREAATKDGILAVAMGHGEDGWKES